MTLSDRAKAESGRLKQLKNAVEQMDTDDGYFSYGPIAWDALSDAEREVLNQLLHTGPVWDGNILSKSGRDTLLEFGLAVRCCFLGEDGYAAASYKGLRVFKSSKAAPFEKKKGSEG